MIKKIEKMFDTLIGVLFICVFFESITLFRIGTFNFTIPFIIFLIMFILSIILLLKNKIEIKKLILFSLFLISMILSSIFSGFKINFSSLFLHIFFLLFYLIIKPNKMSDERIIGLQKKYVILATIFGVYAIYQFIGYNFINKLPFQELIPNVLLTKGYNTFTVAWFGFDTYKRAHSIYLEASMLSQISSIAIVFTLFLKFETKDLFKKIIIILINIIAIIASLSGSGLLLLIFGGIYWLYKTKNEKLTFALISIAILGIFVMFIFSDNPIIGYYIKRISEISLNSNHTSGYYRFILPFVIFFNEMFKRFFGFGIGNDGIAFKMYGSNEDIIANGYGKMAVELGLFGLILFIIFLLSFKPNKNAPSSVKVLFYMILIYCAINGSIVQTSFWCYVIILMCFKNNISLIEENFKSDIKERL